MRPFITPLNIIVNGASQTGKSQFVARLIKHRHKLFTDTPKRIHYFYGVYQPLYDTLKKEHGVCFYRDLPDSFDEFYDNGEPQLIVLDDLQVQAVGSESVQRLFLLLSHHLNLTVILTCHNIFASGKVARNLALNTHVMVLFKSLRDGCQLIYLGRQIYPKNSHILLEAHEDATGSNAYGYLIVDMSVRENPDYRLRTQVFPDDDHMIIYKPH